MKSRLKYSPKSSSNLIRMPSDRGNVSNLPEESVIKDGKAREMKEVKKQINRLLESGEKSKEESEGKTPIKWLRSHSRSQSNRSESKDKGKLDLHELSNASIGKYGSVQLFIFNGSKTIELILGGFTAGQRRTLIERFHLQKIGQINSRLA